MFKILCGAVMADGITSANIVGYNKVSIPDNYFKIAAAPFEAVDGSMAVNKLLTGMTGVDYDDEGAYLLTAPMIQIPKGAGYETLHYLNNGYYIDADGNETYAAGWCDDDGNLATAGNAATQEDLVTEFTPGIGYWVKDIPGGGDVQFAGAVATDDAIDIVCPVTFTIRGGAFPTDVVVNDTTQLSSADIVGVDYDDEGAYLLTAPQIQIPKGAGYETLHYLNNGYYIDADENETYAAGWCDDDGNLATVGNTATQEDLLTSIPAGVGFWTKGVTGAFTLTYGSPLK